MSLTINFCLTKFLHSYFISLVSHLLIGMKIKYFNSQLIQFNLYIMKKKSLTNTTELVKNHAKTNLSLDKNQHIEKKEIKKLFSRKPVNGVKPTCKIQNTTDKLENSKISSSSKLTLLQSSKLLKYVKSHADINLQNLILSQSNSTLSLRSVTQLTQSRLSIDSIYKRSDKNEQKKVFERKTQKNMLLQRRNNSKQLFQDLNNSQVITTNKNNVEIQEVYKYTAPYINKRVLYPFNKNNSAIQNNLLNDEKCVKCFMHQKQIQSLHEKLEKQDKMILQKEGSITNLKSQMKQLQSQLVLLNKQKIKQKEENQKQIKNFKFQIQNQQIQTINLQENYQEVVGKVKYLQIQNQTLKMLKIQIEKQRKKYQLLSIEKQNMKTKFSMMKKIYMKNNGILHQNWSERDERQNDCKGNITSRDHTQTPHHSVTFEKTPGFFKNNRVQQYQSQWNESQLSELTSLSQQSIF